MQYPGYFLIVWDFVRYAREHGIPVGPGRGSAAGSLLAYALRITDLDPLQYDLIFERFLNPERVTLPDIDIDFCMERRDEVINYVIEKYGKDNVAQIITFGKMLAKGVIRDVGRALDLPYSEVDKIAKLVPAKLNMTLKRAMEDEPRLKELAQQEGMSKTLLELAQKLEGITRHASIHAAGVVISPQPLTEFLPLYKASRGDEITTQFTMEDIEALGLLKIDFLGLRTLTVIHHTLALIRQGRGEDLMLEEIPLDDKATYQLLSEAKTFGIFQLESQGLRDILQKLQPEVFEDLIALVALYRPGPLGSGMIDNFIQRKHGKVPIVYELPQLETILKETYGVIVYQEQVMKIASTLAGFSLGAADLLRRAMGKKKPEVMAQQRAKFVGGALANGISKEKAEKIFALMEYFAGYGFNKSHSAAYALIAYQTAYLKAHYPTEYMAALLTSDMEKTDKVVRYIRECQEMDIPILSPDVNESYRDFRVVGKQIRFGLAAVKNVGEGAIENILQVRGERKFDSWVDFCHRVDLRVVNRRVIESLIKCGAFDSLGEKRAQMIASLDEVLESAQRVSADRANGQINLFGPFAEQTSLPATRFPSGYPVKEWEESQLLAHEKEALGFYITGHPLSRFKHKLLLYANADAERLQTLAAGMKVTLGGMVQKVRLQNTRKGDRMAFLTLEDLHGAVEVIIFPDVYQQCASLLEAEMLVFVRGTVDSGEKSTKVIAEQLFPLEGHDTSLFSRLHLTLRPSRHERIYLEKLCRLLQRTPGPLQVYLHFLFPDNREVVMLAASRFQVSPSDSLVHDIEALLGTGAISID
jgi:DNA polymerase-3 subunit alpha